VTILPFLPHCKTQREGGREEEKKERREREGRGKNQNSER